MSRVVRVSGYYDLRRDVFRMPREPFVSAEEGGDAEGGWVWMWMWEVGMGLDGAELVLVYLSQSEDFTCGGVFV